MKFKVLKEREVDDRMLTETKHQSCSHFSLQTGQGGL
jgi:hypothetical protein